MDAALTNGAALALSTASAPVTGVSFDIRQAEGVTVQASVEGTGAVTATVIVEVSNDNKNWLTAGTITLSGTTVASDGFLIIPSWAHLRFRCTAISGTGALVTAYIGARS